MVNGKSAGVLVAEESVYYVYVLKSERDCKCYTGYTSDLDQRVKDHNAGKVSSTCNRRPLELIYFEKYETKALAEKREHFLKTGDGRKVLKNLLPATKTSAGSPPHKMR